MVDEHAFAADHEKKTAIAKTPANALVRVPAGEARASAVSADKRLAAGPADFLAAMMELK